MVDLFNTWGGVIAMFALAVAIFACSSWSGVARKRAIDQDKGIELSRFGRGFVVAGLIIGGSGPLFGEMPPALPWREIADIAILGVAAGLFVAGRTTAKWDEALREKQSLPSHVVAWWQSRWVTLGIMVALLLFSLLYPAAVASATDAFGNFGATSGYLISSFSFAFGLLISVWAKRKARQYGKPIKLPLVRK